MCVLQVHEHKTNNLYGAGRVAFSQQSAELLLNYGTGRLKLQESSVMMHPYADINCSAKFARNFKDVSEKQMVLLHTKQGWRIFREKSI